MNPATNNQEPLGGENNSYRSALERIKAMTDADNPESYRCDDSEGCLDTVFDVASKAIASQQQAGAAGVSEVKPWHERLVREEHEFKNFHRMLCERFDYQHDERDWKRDQVSLVEHIYQLARQRQGSGEPVGEAGTMPGTSGFTMACFKAADVPVGTKLYTTTAAQADEVRDAARDVPPVRAVMHAAHSAFNEALPPMSLTSLGHANVYRALEAAVGEAIKLNDAFAAMRTTAADNQKG